MKKLALSVLFMFLGDSTVFAQSAGMPILHEGDKWIYNVTEEINTAGVIQSSSKKWINSISRVGSRSFTLTSKPIDSNLPPKEYFRNPDWSIESNIAGASLLIAKPYSFPMESKKSWKIEFTEQNPNDKVKLNKTTKEYTVIGWEKITVPAGTFMALKVEMDGRWYSEFNTIAPSASTATSIGKNGAIAVAKSTVATTPTPVSGKLYQAYWYVPEIRNSVKSIIEDYQAGGQLNKRHVEELDSLPQ